MRKVSILNNRYLPSEIKTETGLNRVVRKNRSMTPPPHSIGSSSHEEHAWKDIPTNLCLIMTQYVRAAATRIMRIQNLSTMLK